MKPIILDNVSKFYRRLGRSPTLAEIAGKGIRALKGQKASDNTRIDALKDISFKVEKGEILGIIGPNGAGKTTILSLIAGVTRPTNGKVSVHGRIAPLIALGAGFHPELTGRENIYLNSIIMGMTKKEVQKRFDAIVDFAELGEFLNTPVKRYSSGMHARLGFATAIHIDPDILLVDEVLAVGDLAFQSKCMDRIEKFKDKDVTTVFVTHNLDSVRRICNRVILVNKGEIIIDGTPNRAISGYMDSLAETKIDLGDVGLKKDAEIQSVELYNKNAIKTTNFQSGDAAVVRIQVKFNQNMKANEIGFFIHRMDRVFVVSTGTKDLGVELTICRAGEVWVIEFPFQVNLLHGTYQLGTEVRSERFNRYLDYIESAITFNVSENYAHGGVVHLDPSCRVKKVVDL